ncbi:hypothetical protein CBS101457_000769 [Exobasidium rhododendri]|nr:hypothetical protein CBS101457_000769 [Exobasidium rhododendri]
MTSLLYDHRDGLAFTPLLLVVAAEGIDLGLPPTGPLFKEGAMLSVQELIERAESELKGSGYISTISSHSMSMCQALLLLAYRMINSRQISRAVVYLSLCSQTLDGIWEKRCADAAAEVKMNGVQMASVEEELLCNLTWIASSFSMWITLQFPNLSMILQSSKYRLDFGQLPITEVTSRSSIYQLDYMSGNLSALKSQERNGRILSSLASVHCYVEHYLCETATTSFLSLDSQVALLDKEAQILVATVSRFLGLKSCLLSSSTQSTPSNKTLIQSTHVQVILAIAEKTVEATATSISRSTRSPSSSFQATTVELQVDTISNLVVAFELLFAFTLPLSFQRGGSHEVVINNYFEKFAMDSTATEAIENHKWQMMMTLQSLGIILNQENMSCTQRINVKKQVDNLTGLVQAALFANDIEFAASSSSTTTATSQSSTSSTFSPFTSSNMFISGADAANPSSNFNDSTFTAGQYDYAHHPNLGTPTQSNYPPHKFTQNYLYDHHPRHDQSPVSPRYFSIPFSDVDDISVHPIFNPFHQIQSMAPASRDLGPSSTMMYYQDDNLMPPFSPAEQRPKYDNDAYHDGSSTLHSISLHTKHNSRSQMNVQTDPALIHYSNSDANLSNSPYPTDLMLSDYRTS